eukprot:g9064.t1
MLPHAKGASPDFKMGDRVQLKGHAANPNYEGKLYTVEAVDMSGTVMVSHKLGDRNVSRLLSCSVLRLDVGKLIVRMTFHKAWLELVTPAEDIPPEPAPEVMEAPKPQVDPIESLHVGDTVRVVGLGPRHNGRMCSVEAVDMRRRILRVKFLESNDMLELGPTYLELVEKARDSQLFEQPSIAPIRQGVQGEGGLRVGDTVRILAPPQHRGKVATVEASLQSQAGKVGIVEMEDDGAGCAVVQIQDSMGLARLRINPVHLDFA